MTLHLNDPRVEYQEFFGRYNEQMPRLISEERVPMSVADIMHRRLEVANSTPDVRAAWLDNYFDTSDGIAYHPNGTVKVIPDAAPLHAITPQDTLSNGALFIIYEDIYQGLDGPTISRSDLPSGKSLTQHEVLNNPVWNALARDDQALLREYTNLVFTDAKQRFGYEKNMGIYLSATPDTPAFRAWYVNRIYYWSVLFGSNDLDNNSSRLVGVAPEAPARERTPGTLDASVHAALTSRQAFTYNGTIYAPQHAPNLRLH